MSSELEIMWQGLSQPVSGFQFGKEHPGFRGFIFAEREFPKEEPRVYLVGDVDDSLEWGGGYETGGAIGTVYAFAPIDGVIRAARATRGG